MNKRPPSAAMGGISPANGQRFSLGQQIAELRREIGLRAAVYPGLVTRGKMRRAEADYHLAVMQAALRTLLFVQRHREALVRLADEAEAAGSRLA